MGQNMAKKDEKPAGQVNGQNETQTATVSPEQAENQALREELADLQAAYAAQAAELVQAQSDKQDLQAQLNAQKQPEQQKAQDTRESVWVKTANGAEFWRGGVLFNGDWREVKRGEVDESAWQRIVSEPALHIKAQAD